MKQHYKKLVLISLAFFAILCIFLSANHSAFNTKKIERKNTENTQDLKEKIKDRIILGDAGVANFPPANVYGPFRKDMADNDFVSYLIIPPADNKEDVLRIIREITGEEGLFIAENVTLLSSNIEEDGKAGDLYQLSLNKSNEEDWWYGFDILNNLERHFGPASRASFKYITLDTSQFLYDFVEHHTLIDRKGQKFLILVKDLNGDIKITHSEIPLPEQVIKEIESPLYDDVKLYLDLQKGRMVMGYTEVIHKETDKNVYQNKLTLFSENKGTWKKVKTIPLASVESKYNPLEITFLLSPDRKHLAVSNSSEYEYDLLNQNVIISLDTFSVKKIEGNPHRFPTAWTSNDTVLFGSAVGRDCGYTPFHEKYSLNGQFSKKDPTVKEPFEEYLLNGTLFEHKGKRVALSTGSSTLRTAGGMCDNGEVLKDAYAIDGAGSRKIIYRTLPNEFITDALQIGDSVLLRVVSTESFKKVNEVYQLINDVSKPHYQMISISKGNVSPINYKDVKKMIESEKSSQYSFDRASYIKSVSKSTISVTYRSEVVKKGNRPISQIDADDSINSKTSANFRIWGGSESVAQNYLYDAMLFDKQKILLNNTQ